MTHRVTLRYEMLPPHARYLSDCPRAGAQGLTGAGVE